MVTPNESASNILETLTTLYTNQHIFRVTDPAQFPKVDRKFYDTSQVTLEKLGFSKLADIEDVTVNSTNPPEKHTFIRAMVSADRSIQGSIFHIPSESASLLMRIISFLFRLPHQSYYIIDLETELMDGSFLTTSNAELAASIQFQIPGLQQQFFSAQTTAEELLQAHKSALKRLLAQTGSQPLLVQSFDDIVASQHRLQALKNADRQTHGFVTDEDIDRIANGRYKNAAEILKQSLEEAKNMNN